MRTKTVATLAGTALALLALAVPASALGAPVLDIGSSHYPTSYPVPAGTYAKYTLKVSNTGDAPTSANVNVDFAVPAGLEVAKVGDELEQFGFPAWSCSIAGNAQSVSCSGPEFFGSPLEIGPGEEACVGLFGVSCRLLVTVKADPNATPGTVSPTIEACAGGAVSCASASDPLEVGPPPSFEVAKFDGRVLKSNGDPATQAGAHPDTATTEFFANNFLGEKGWEFTTEQLKDAIVKLPPGLVGNAAGFPTCTQEQLTLEAGRAGNGCPPDSQLGEVHVLFDGSLVENPGETAGGGEPRGVFNMQRPPGTSADPGSPGLFGFNIGGVNVMIYAKLRSGEDYGVTVINKNAPQTLPIAGVVFKFWGVPADPDHDEERGKCLGTVVADSCPTSAAPKPFLSLPTSCVGPVETPLTLTSWQGGEASSSFLSHDNGEPPTQIGADGCNAVDFSPTLQARPTTNVADSASGLDVDLHVPQHESCDPGPPVACEAAEANLKDTTVTLPPGLVINPSAANGLGGCAEAQLGFTSKEGDTIHTTPDPASCPDSAKLGSVEVDSPLVDHPLKGNVYIANPYANPFGSLLAIYITVDDPQTGTVVKLAGEVHANPDTGQLTTTVLHNPQLPFEDFKLHFFGGAGGSLRTPAVCGTYSTTSSLTPWTAPEGLPATPSDAWQIAQAPSGGTCPGTAGGEPNIPNLDAGTVSPIAGSFSPMVIDLRREDGSQNFSTVTITPPPGLLGKLAGIPYCPEAALASAASKTGTEEQASPSCPSASQIGTVSVAAGAGPAPYWAKGIAYLTGPYKGAPLGLAIVTPAVAGPFDLGTVVVRTALHVDPATAQITAVSDPIPSILQGIPLDVRQALIHLDKPGFTLNPTSCNPLSFSGGLLSTLGQTAPLAERFQVGECGRLSFKPKLAFRLVGGTRRGAHPALNAVVTMPEGSANIAKAVVALPHSEFLDQGHIGTVCTRVQYAARECPAASVYGKATAFSPLLDAPLSGPVYLRSSDNKLPDLVASLDGQIHVDLDGRVDSVKGGIRTTFEGVPDAAVSKFVLEMQGASKGLLQNSTNICLGKHLATAEFDGQNGKAVDLAPPLKAKCPKARKGHKRHRRTARHHRAVR